MASIVNYRRGTIRITAVSVRNTIESKTPATGCLLMSFAILSIQLSALAFMAQGNPCVRRTVAVTVSNGDSKPVTGLAPENFQATFRHHPIKVLSVNSNDKPSRVFLILDASGSMAQDAKIWRAYIAVAEEVLDRLPVTTLLGFMVFNDHVDLTVPLSSDRRVIRRQLERFRSQRPIGSTALLDTLRAAALQFGQPMPGDSIYAVTDGDDDASRIGIDNVEEVLLGRGIRLFSFSIKSKGYLPPQLRWERGPTPALVEVTGGFSILIPASRAEALFEVGKDTPDQNSDRTLLSQQLTLISTFELVEVELPEALHKLENWDLRTAGMAGSDWIVKFPHKLAPCPAN